jgi:hypothetical protein
MMLLLKRACVLNNIDPLIFLLLKKMHQVCFIARNDVVNSETCVCAQGLRVYGLGFRYDVANIKRCVCAER